MSPLWTLLLSLLVACLEFTNVHANCGQRYVRSPTGQLFHFIPVRLFTPELGQHNAELVRQPRQQQIVQEVNIVNENNFGRPTSGFGGPPFGGPPFGGPPFGGRPFGSGGFGGGVSGGFGGGFGGGFRGGFGRSTGLERSSEPEQQEQESPKLSMPVQYETPGVPVPPCAQSYLISCEAVLKPAPCAAQPASCNY